MSGPGRLLRTTAFRIALLFAAWFLACAGVLLVTIEWYAVGSLQDELRGTVSARLAAILEDHPGADAAALIRSVDNAGERDPGALMLLQDAQGRRLAGNLPARAPVAGWLELRVPGPAPAGMRDPHPVVARGVRLPDGGYLLVGQDAFALAEVRELILRAFAIGGALTLLLALAGGFLVSRGVLSRIAAVARAGQHIMHGDLSRRLPVRGSGDELDELVSGFNALLDRIGVLMETMQQVTNDIAHDLRTPLTRLRGRLDEVRRHPRSAAEYEAAIDRSIADAQNLLDTFAALLRIAQIEATAGDATPASIDVAGLLATVVEVYEPLAEERGQTITADAAPLRIQGERELLIQMLGNLVENACRHTPPGSHVRIGAQPHDAGVVLWVEDNGPGIPAAERERVLRRFYRLDSSRSSPGSGLGLSLAAAIAARHRGEIRLLDAAPGLRVEVLLPGRRAG